MTAWRNWGRSVLAHPTSIETPRDETEVVALLSRAAGDRRRVRPVGAGHSFTPIAATDGVMVRLDALSGVRRVDGHEVTLGAGTRLRDLPALLRPYGLALENMGDIDTQTVAGAISTGTHGTGTAFAGIAAQVTGLRLVLAGGGVVDCSGTVRPELFQAARIGLGAFGVLTEVTIRCVPAFLLAADEHPMPLAPVLEHFDQITAGADHVEFYWFPHTDTALVKSNTRLGLESGRRPLPRWRSTLDDEAMSNGLFAATCGLGWLVPQVVPTINRVAAHLVSTRTFTDDSYSVFTSPRRVRFREMEYAIDRDAIPEAIREIRTLIQRKGWRISFPLEIRVAAADDVWLSTAYGRPSAYVAVHRYHRDPFAEYFLAVQEVLLAFGGRPHWGKLHSLGHEQLRARYPRFGDALAVRDTVDPDRRFANPYLDRVLGP
ncbi:FAD-linked oxidoreductase [Nakamurella panacisegetis]|uniref:FAD-linked oxidoreductase n=1 Tax=Nakamurella panacisegetis TaxID=1090615 RepID=A0A1H0K4I7_9ACTN|nr:D-arabinono-1,4-lactone oxidase [Nakamurella panacisegetis]SDO50786.1 FAD-linked oxidoreductase [Nakamurella panacisegetis]